MTDRIELELKDTNAGCSCCATAGSEVSVAVESAVAQDVFVDGMTCSHCVSSVTDELTSLEGVDSVSVDLNAGGTSRVTIHSAAPVDDESIRVAVEEAGYALTSQPS